jgi:hypothetical protein
MREELDQLLCEKYPKIFRDRNAPMEQTCMYWGFSCDDGWFNIIDRLCANIQWHIDQVIENNERNQKHVAMVTAAKAGDFTLFDAYYTQSGFQQEWIDTRRADILTEEIAEWRMPKEEIPQVIAAQVKEKFGTLRFYYSGGDDIIDGMVRMAESMSAVTCEECGSPGTRTTGGWIRTLCETHKKEK